MLDVSQILRIFTESIFILTNCGVTRQSCLSTDTPSNNGLSYAQAGVDIDAGNALVEAIKPAVKSTARAGSNPDIGGFGGLFDMKAAGFRDPVLVAANDGVGTKLKNSNRSWHS